MSVKRRRRQLLEALGQSVVDQDGNVYDDMQQLAQMFAQQLRDAAALTKNVKEEWDDDDDDEAEGQPDVKVKPSKETTYITGLIEALRQVVKSLREIDSPHAAEAEELLGQIEASMAKGFRILSLARLVQQGHQKVAGQVATALGMQFELGPEGLPKSWQKEFEPETACIHCGGKSRIGFVAHEGMNGERLPYRSYVCSLHPNEGKGNFWLHDVVAVAVYFCKECLEPTAKYTQA
jgi:formate dehydrogenase maturation protein FdhE